MLVPIRPFEPRLLLSVPLAAFLFFGAHPQGGTSLNHGHSAEAAAHPVEPPPQPGADALTRQGSNPCLEFDELNSRVRDQRIDRAAAHERIRTLLPRIRAYFYAHGGKDAPRNTWRFPLAGYGARDIGGTNGSGYIVEGYDYFDGYKSVGHPGHDIFIRDRDQDELDDVTGKPVAVVSITNGIVVAYATQWEPGSRLRGGRYVYVYDPADAGVFYYGHNRAVLVRPGDIVTAGQTIATVGRSGRNAFPRRSPTHLHAMFLRVEDGYPTPQDTYRDLLRIAARKP